MGMSTVNAKTYVARILGGTQSQNVLDMAGEALLRSYNDWQTARFWTFLLKDTSSATLATGVTATGASAIVNAPTTGAFDFVNVNQTVTVSSGTATLAAATTVSSITRGSDGVITSITLSAAFGGTTNTNATLTFTADIPIRIDVEEYNLPLDFSGSYSARLLNDPKGWIAHIDYKLWDRYQADHDVNLPIDAYTTYNPVSEMSQNFGTTRLRIFGLPDAANVLRLRYYRKFTTGGTNIDIPDEYLYKFLDYARGILLEVKRAQDDPGGYAASVAAAVASAQDNDEQPNEDEEQRMKSPYEMGANRPIVGNGQFSTDPW